MSAASSVSDQPAPALLDRERIIAKPASTAGSCRRPRSASISASAWPTASRCSGSRCRAPSSAPTASRCRNARPGAVTFAEKSLGTLQGADRDRLQLEPVRPRLDVHVLLRAARRLGRDLGRLARARRSAQGGLVSALCWCGGLLISAPRRLHPPALADVDRRRRHRRHRPRPRLHLAGLDAHQMVPRPPRHGDRHGHHGLRRRRHDRLAARHHPDEPLQDGDRSRASGRRSSPSPAIYFVFMLIGAFGYRLPPAGWKPEGWTPPRQRTA